MTKETLEKDVKDATTKLLELARGLTWNPISDNCKYILSEIDGSAAQNFLELRKIRKQNNEKKTPKSLNQIIGDLEKIYSNLYDLNLYVYKAKPKLTIVEIQYYPKSSLDEDYLGKVKDNAPMLRCKVALPPYSKDNEKFDINWELGGLRHQWKLFWWRLKIKKGINRLHDPRAKEESTNFLTHYL